MFFYEPDVRNDAPKGLFLSRKGNWFHDGDRLHHLRMCSLLHRSIDRDDDDNLIVTTGRDKVPFIAEGTPFLIKAFFLRASTGPKKTQSFFFRRSDDVEEEVSCEHRFVTTPTGAILLSVKGHRFWAEVQSNAQQWLVPYWQTSTTNPQAFVLSLPSDEGHSRQWELKEAPLDVDFCAAPVS